jgi:hypothetical protein
VTSDVPWLQVDPPAGQGEASLTLHVSENQLPSTRTGAIQINDVQLTLAQAAADVRAAPSPSVRFSGLVSGLTGACPTLTFAVARRPVRTNKETRFSDGKCKDLRDGTEVEVTGRLTADGIVEATRIEREED